MNLLKAELRRILRRRLTIVFGAIAGAALLLLVGVLWATSSRGPSADQLAEAQALADEANANNPDFSACMNDEDYFVGNEYYGWAVDEPAFEEMTHEERCQTYVGGTTAESFIYTYTFDFSEEGAFILIGIAVVTGLIMMMLASSVVGAEWSSGGMSNLMVWHPNRFALWGAKLGSLLLFCLAAVVGLVALGFGLLVMTASVRGEIGTLDSVWWGDTLPMLTRTAVLGLMMTTLGASLAMLGRHTAIAAGVIAGYLIVGDLLVRLASFALQMAFPDRLSLYTWVIAWISGRIELYDWNASGWDVAPDTMVITATDAGLLLGGIVVGFAVLATWSFHRRDAA